MKDFLVLIEIIDDEDEIIAYKTLIVKAESKELANWMIVEDTISNDEYDDLKWEIEFVKELSSIQTMDNKKDIQDFIKNEIKDIEIEYNFDEDFDTIINDNNSNILIKNNKVIINGEEIYGIKKYLYLFGIYATVPLIIVPILFIILMAGSIITLSIPMIILFLVISIIIGIIGVFKR